MDSLEARGLQMQRCVGMHCLGLGNRKSSLVNATWLMQRTGPELDMSAVQIYSVLSCFP